MSGNQIFLAVMLVLLGSAVVLYQASRIVACDERNMRAEMMSTLVWMIVSTLSLFAVIVRW